MKTTATGASAPLPFAAVPRDRVPTCERGDCNRCASCERSADEARDPLASVGYYPTPTGYTLCMATAWGGAR